MWNNLLPVFLTGSSNRGFHQPEIFCIKIGPDKEFILVMVNVILKTSFPWLNDLKLAIRRIGIEEHVFIGQCAS